MFFSVLFHNTLFLGARVKGHGSRKFKNFDSAYPCFSLTLDPAFMTLDPALLDPEV
jgi:hypothetical protein